MHPKAELLSRLLKSGVIAVIRRVSIDDVEQVGESLVEGGITTLEVAVDDSDDFIAIRRLVAKMGDRAIVGAGTVLDAASARLAIAHGAQFVFSPNLNREVVQTTLRYGKVAVPGVMTPTEMVQAVEAGADLVKLFPASGLGTAHLKQIRGPLPHIPVIPTGGIHLENAADFIEAGAVAVGIGGDLVNRQVIEARQFSHLTEKAKQYVQAVKAARAGSS